MLSPILIEWIGYTASVLILVSLLMTSIVRLRWINLVGAILFAFYGFMIHSIPTGVMNSVIVLVNIHFLIKIHRSREYFSILNTQPHDQYLVHFLNFYKSDIRKFYPDFDLQTKTCDMSFYVLRNMTTAGLFMGKRLDEQSLQILIDYATPAYRDFKVGRFIYTEKESMFRSLGYQRLFARLGNAQNEAYFKQMGFIEDDVGKGRLVKTIT
jgi:hypothetical protein